MTQVARGPPGAAGPGPSTQQQTDDAALIVSHRQTLTAMRARLAAAMGAPLSPTDTPAEAPEAPFEPPASASKIETLGWLVSQLAEVQVRHCPARRKRTTEDMAHGTWHTADRGSRAGGFPGLQMWLPPDRRGGMNSRVCTHRPRPSARPPLPLSRGRAHRQA